MAYQVAYSIYDTVAGQIRDLLTTPKGTLPLDADYGLNFNLIDTDAGYAIDMVEFKLEIRRLLGKYVPRINAKDANVTIKYDRNTGILAVDVDGITVNLAENPNAPRVNPVG